MPDQIITVETIVRDKLKELGADGLCLPDGECGCGLDDLAPCGDGFPESCRPAWKKICRRCRTAAYFNKPLVGGWICDDCKEAGCA